MSPKSNYITLTMLNIAVVFTERVMSINEKMIGTSNPTLFKRFINGINRKLKEDKFFTEERALDKVFVHLNWWRFEYWPKVESVEKYLYMRDMMIEREIATNESLEIIDNKIKQFKVPPCQKRQTMI